MGGDTCGISSLFLILSKYSMLRFLISFYFLGWALVVNAQQANVSDPDLLAETDLLGEFIGIGENSVIIDQIGSNNEVEVIQRQRYQQNNQTRILQQGNDNLAEILQAGGNNQVILLQNGNENEFRLDLSGTNNDIAVIQRGDQNEIRQRLSNARDLNLEYVQRGDGNLIEHQADGLVSKNIKVLQSGNNMEVIINQSSIALPPARQ